MPDPLPMAEMRVRFAETWGDSWANVPGAFVAAFDNGTVHSPGSARVVLRSAGMVLEPGDAEFAQRGWTDLVGWYCWVEEAKPGGGWRHRWLGYVSEESQSPERSDVAAGRQEVVCEGIVRLLDRMPVASSWWRRGSENIEVNLYPEFNRLSRRDGTLVGNRRKVPEAGAGYSGDGYVFVGDDDEDALVWNNHNIAQSLLDFHTPDGGPAWVLDGQLAAPGAIRQAWSAGQQSVGDWLRRLLSPSSGMDAAADYDGADTVTLRVFTLYGADVDAGGVTIPANEAIVDYPLPPEADFPANHRLLAAPVVRTVNSASYARIVCRTKEPILVVGEWSVGTKLEPSWPTALQADYIDPPGIDAVQAKDDYRRKEKFRGVFEDYVHLGECDDVRPLANDDGTVELSTEGAWLKGGGLHFESWTPFEEGVDYSTHPPTRTDPPTGMTGAEHPPQYKPIHAYFNIERDAAEFWRPAERLGELDTGLHSFRPHPLTRRFGVSLQSSYAQHYGKKAVTGFKSMKPGLIDYDGDRTLVVAAFRAPERQRYVETMESPAGAIADIGADLVFDVPGTDCWIASAGIAVGVDEDGVMQTLPAGAELLRDDSDALKAAAAVLKAWYGNPRRELSLLVSVEPSDGDDPMIPAVGTYIENLTDEAGGTLAVGSVVTRQEFRIEKQGDGWRWACTVKCGYGGNDMGRAMAAEFAGRRQRRLR